jgi:DNA mismatch endonuclease, patch repair protein
VLTELCFLQPNLIRAAFALLRISVNAEWSCQPPHSAMRLNFSRWHMRRRTRQNTAMTDVHTREVRRANMAAVRSRDTKPERIVRRVVHGMGFRFRLHDRELPGTPDVVLPRHGKVIFVHGCFWHKHDCRAGRSVPATRTEFWGKKRDATVARDLRAVSALKDRGWSILIVWECWTRDASLLTDRLRAFLNL